MNRFLLATAAILLAYSTAATYVAAGVVKENVVTRLAAMEAVQAKYRQREAAARQVQENADIRIRAAMADKYESDLARINAAAMEAAAKATQTPRRKPPPPMPAPMPAPLPDRELVYSSSRGGINLTEVRP